ncbi:MAG TPA: DUF2341 domain-containing protein [Porticoccus sp.]|nr:DUF2341 domain-containing protein [Porticoccus sp.]
MKKLVIFLMLCSMCGMCFGITKRISITNPTGETLYQFPVELVITTQINWSDIDSGFTSLRFLSGGEPINHWIEFLDVSNEKAVIWVRMPELTAAGKDIYMNYSNNATTAFAPTTYAAKIERPAAESTFLTRPQDENAVDLPMLHPCVVKAPAGEWISKAATGDSQNVFWVMVNTPFAPTAFVDGLSPAWTQNQTEVPALWYNTNADPTTDNWGWPTGYEEWPDVNSGDDFTLALNRVNHTLHPSGTNSNYVFSPQVSSAVAWSDPTMIYMADTDTLRVYCRSTHTEKFTLYYADITSPADNAWEDAGGTSHLTFVTGAPTIDGNPFDFDAFGGIEYLSPSIFWSDKINKYVCVAQLFLDGSKPQSVVTLTSDDGLEWTRTNTAALGQATGLEKQGWHTGVMEADNKWFMYATTGVIDTSAIIRRGGVMCWTSVNDGASWEIELPWTVAQELLFTTNANGYKPIFVDPYRPWPVWDEGGQGFVLFMGFKQTGDATSGNNGTVGGTFAAKDTDWSPVTPQEIGNINGVFWMLGINFSDSYAQGVTDERLEWPVVMKDNNSKTGVFTIINDGLNVINDTGEPESVAYFGGDFTADFQCRFRFQDSLQFNLSTGWLQRSSFSGSTPQVRMLTTGNNSILELHSYTGTSNAVSSPTELASTQSMVDDPVTVNYKAMPSSAGDSTMQILRHNGFDSAVATYTTAAGGLTDNRWDEGSFGNFAPYYQFQDIAIRTFWAFAKPAYVNEPVATVEDMQINFLRPRYENEINLGRRSRYLFNEVLSD